MEKKVTIKTERLELTLEGYSIREIAEILNSDVSTSQTREVDLTKLLQSHDFKSTRPAFIITSQL